MFHRRTFLAFAILSALACKRSEQPITASKDVPSARPSTSASVSAAPSSSATAGVFTCLSGELFAPTDPIGSASAEAKTSAAPSSGTLFGGNPADSLDYGGLGLPGSGRRGGFGSGATFEPLRLDATLVEPTGATARPSAMALCASHTKLLGCFLDGLARNPKLAGTLRLAITVADGKVSTAVEAKSLDDAPVEACVSDVVRTAVSARAGKLVYALVVSQRPGPKMIDVGADVTGRLPKEVVKRIVRANYPRFGACYDQGRKKDPKLAGTVSAKFVVDGTGAIESVTASGSMTDEKVKSCVLAVYRTLSFPEPEEGKVTVTYGIDFRQE